MPGIAGIVDFTSDKSSIKKSITLMVRILNHTSSSIEEELVFNHASFGAVRLTNCRYHDLIEKDKYER